MRAFVALTLTLLLCGCGLFPGKSKEATTPGGRATLIGVVEMVNPEQYYVLIRCEQALAIDPGTELYALDAAGVRTSLKLTPERKGLFLTADILAGQPKVGSLVMQSAKTVASEAPPPSPPPAPPPALPELPLLPLDPVPSAAPVTPDAPTPLSELEPVVR